MTQTINFLADQPSPNDAFGSHSRVADAVAEIVRNAGPIHVIGLLGGWGSGKSTVVRQIEKCLTKDDNEGIHFFSYDAWLHQNDHPRRAFLEELIGNLTVAKIVEREIWEPRLAELAGQSQETETETTRKLSDTGKYIFLALAFVPVGLGFLDFDLLAKAFESPSNRLAQFVLSISLLMVLAPLIVVGWIYWRWRPWPEQWTRETWKHFWTRHASPNEDKSILSLLTDQSVERTLDKTRISPDPTAIEFREAFNGLLRSCSDKGRHLVIVIDNLDRLAEEEAMQLWATIRSLFLGNNAALGSAEDLRPPSIILPIDEGAIRRMFRITHGADAKNLAQSFLDKTFDITFQINEPVMSDWRQFLGDKLHEVFGDHVTADQLYWTCKILEEANGGSRASKSLTPRKLIKFANALGALIAQWQRTKIDFLSIVLYVAHRDEVAENIFAFVNGDRPTIDAAAPTWKRDVAALHFGVTPDKAYQAMLAGDLRDAISSLDREVFKNLAASIGAAEIIEEVIAAPPAVADGSTDADFIANAALLISELCPSKTLWAQNALNELRSRWLTASTIEAWRDDLPQIVALLAPSTKAKAEEFLAVTSKELGEALVPAVINQKVASEFSKAVDALHSVGEKHGLKVPPIEVGLSTSEVFTLATHISRTARPLIKANRPSAEMLQEMQSALTNKDKVALLPAVVLAFAHRSPIKLKDDKLNWQALAQAAYDIVASNGLGHMSTLTALNILGLLYTKNPQAKQLADQTFDSQRLTQLANEAETQKNVPAMAVIAALMLLREQDFGAPNNKQWDAIIKGNSGLMMALRSKLTEFRWENGTGFALEGRKKKPKALPLIQALVRYEIDTHRSIGMPTRYFMTHFEEIIGEFGADVATKSMIDETRHGVFWTVLSEMGTGRSFNLIVSTVITNPEIDRKRVAAAVWARLDAMGLEDWRNEILESLTMLPLARIYRQELGQTKGLGDNLRAALREQGQHLLSLPSNVRERWFELACFVTPSARATLFKNLRDRLFAGNPVEDLDELIYYGGSQLMDEGRFSDEPDRTARHILIPLLASEGGRSVVETQKDLFSTIAAKSAKETRADMSELLDAIISEATEGEDIESLRKTLRL